MIKAITTAAVEAITLKLLLYPVPKLQPSSVQVKLQFSKNKLFLKPNRPPSRSPFLVQPVGTSDFSITHPRRIEVLNPKF